MNKRFMSLLLVLVMVFSLLPFGALAEGTQGVYAVFGEGADAQPARATYKFVAHGAPYQFNNDKGESTDQQILINGDSLYDVGEPMPNAHETFDGWYVGDQKVEFGTPMTVTANGEVEVVARFTEMHTVTFYADAAGTVVLTVKEVAKNASLPIDGLEAPVVSATNDFAYWTDGTNQYAADGTVQNIIDDVELVPVFSTGAWLSFSANGGSYNAPQFFVGGNVAVGANLPVPTRAGYTFAGWYDGNTQVTNEQGSVTSAISIPAEGKTITARWNANNNVPYKVAYWKQNANPNEDNVYEYSLAAEDIVDCQGTAGANADFQEKTFQGFKPNDEKTDAAATTIKGDGTTVRNVYYDRIEYSITFYQRSRTVNITKDFYLYDENGNRIDFNRGKHNVSDFDGLYYYDSWDDPHSAVGSNRVYYNYTSWGSEDYASVSISTGSWSVNNDLTITDKYGADIFDQWPSTKYPNSGYPSSWRSGDPDGSYASSCGVMPLNGYAFYDNVATGQYTIRDNYYLDNVDGQAVYSQEYSTEMKSDNNLFYLSSGDPITGFTFDNSGNTGTVINANGETETVQFGMENDQPSGGPANPKSQYQQVGNSNVYQLNLHYFRNSYDLTFNSNGGAVVPARSVKYEAPLASLEPESYVVGETTKEVDGVIWIFQGWYDNEDTVGEPFDFDSTMPAHGVSLHAKWEQEQYRIDIDPNGGELSGTEATFTWKKAGDTIDRYDDVTRDYVEDANGTFYYNYHSYGKVSVKDSEDSAPADRVAQYVTDSAAKYADDSTKYAYEEGAYSLIGWYVESADGTRTVCPATFEVTGPTKLVAEWRRSGEYTVVYDGGEHGTVTAQDSKRYVDQAETVAAVAPTAVEGWVFTGWLLNGETYVPGDSFVVDAALANASKAITLVAQYRPADAEGTVPTAAIVWHANNGTDAYVTDETALNKDVAIRAADTFKYDGYVFLGWAKTADAGEDALFLKAVDNGFEAKNGSNWQATSFVATNSTTENNDLYAVWDKIDNHNYVIDFNGKMTIANSATEKKDETNNNGAFEVAGGNATYQLKNNEDSFANGANLAFNGIDTALINGVPVGSAEGTTASWEKYTVIPANNVYFDDDLVGKSMTVGDGSGYNAEVSNYNDAASGQEKTNIEITFTGDGIDVYCTTPNANGWIQATVTKGNGDVVKQPYTNTKYVGGGELHNIPVISFRDLGTGTHTLVITTLTGANYKLDGIRVYNGMQDANETDKATVDTAYAAAKEQNLALMSVRSYLLSKSEFEKVTEEGVDENATVTGAVFIDTNEATTSVADYKAAGPKNEAYLASGQGVAFQIKGWATFKDTNKVMVGLSVPAGGTATVAASGRTGNNKIQLNAETHMFYEIKPDNDGNVYIYNTGKDMVSVTDLKITGTKQYAAPATFTLGAPITPESEGGALTVSPKLLMRYVQDFDPEAVIEDPQVVDEPQTPENPDDGDKPGWNDNSYNPMTILKNLFQNLLNSLSSLFGGLGKW